MIKKFFAKHGITSSQDVGRAILVYKTLSWLTFMTLFVYFYRRPNSIRTLFKKYHVPKRINEWLSNFYPKVHDKILTFHQKTEDYLKSSPKFRAVPETLGLCVLKFTKATVLSIVTNKVLSPIIIPAQLGATVGVMGYYKEKSPTTRLD